MTLNRSLFTSSPTPDLLGKVVLRYLLMGLGKVNENVNLKYQIQYLQDRYSRKDIPILPTELNFPVYKINHLGCSLAVKNKAGNIRGSAGNKDEGNSCCPQRTQIQTERKHPHAMKCSVIIQQSVPPVTGA